MTTRDLYYRHVGKSALTHSDRHEIARHISHVEELLRVTRRQLDGLQRLLELPDRSNSDCGQL